MSIILLTVFFWLIGEALLVDEEVLGQRYEQLWNQFLKDSGVVLE